MARLSWPGWLVKYRGGMPARMWSTILILTGLNLEYVQCCCQYAKLPTKMADRYYITSVHVSQSVPCLAHKVNQSLYDYAARCVLSAYRITRWSIILGVGQPLHLPTLVTAVSWSRNRPRVDLKTNRAANLCPTILLDSASMSL